jgi:hypothetical protein
MLTKIIATVILLGLLTGCVGSPVHSTVKYSSIQSTIRKNNQAILTLSIGLTKQQVIERLSAPESSEGYKWGSVFLYRTAMSSGIYGTEDGDFTPVVFDDQGILIGWGRNFFVEQVKRYQIEVK